MNTTQYKDGGKSLKTFSLNVLVDTMRSRESGRLVDEFREKLQEYPPGYACPAVSKLPRIIFGAEYRKKNREVRMVTYNGLILLEVGNLSGYTEAVDVRRKAAGSLQTLLAFIGSSRKSVKIVVPFTLPDGSLPCNSELAEWFHAHAYQLALNYYQMQLQREITYKQPDVQQSCRLSYDPDLYFNPAAVPATLEQPLQMPGEPTFREMKQQEPLPLERMEAGNERSYSVYLLYQVALKKAIEEVGEGTDTVEADTLLVRLAENCLRAGIPTLNTISLQAQAEGLDLWDRDVKRYVYSNKIPLFNPLDDYLDNLSAWDGKDHIRALADTVPTASKLWRDHFYLWFLGLVAQWKQMGGAYANSVLPLLVGDQGCGKSTWCRNLLPPVLREFYTDSIDFGNRRDAELMLHRFALINIDEFDSVGASRQSFLKHLLQKPEVNARRAYKSSVHALKRYAGFVGTCNNMDLLSDPTGSRRFLCVEIKGEIDRKHSVDHDQLYAQAIHALRAGERYWLTREEEKSVTLQNEEFEQIPVEEQLLLQYFKPVFDDRDETGEWLSVAEVMQRIRKRSRLTFGNTTINAFGRLLRRNNIPSRHALRGNLYHMKEI